VLTRVLLVATILLQRRIRVAHMILLLVVDENLLSICYQNWIHLLLYCIRIHHWNRIQLSSVFSISSYATTSEKVSTCNLISPKKVNILISARARNMPKRNSKNVSPSASPNLRSIWIYPRLKFRYQPSPDHTRLNQPKYLCRTQLFWYDP